MALQAGHDQVHVALQHPGRVRDGLPLTELDVVLAQGDGLATEAGDPDLEGDAGAVGGLLEKHRHRLPT